MEILEVQASLISYQWRLVIYMPSESGIINHARHFQVLSIY